MTLCLFPFFQFLYISFFSFFRSTLMCVSVYSLLTSYRECFSISLLTSSFVTANCHCNTNSYVIILLTSSYKSNKTELCAMPLWCFENMHSIFARVSHTTHLEYENRKWIAVSCLFLCNKVFSIICQCKLQFNTIDCLIMMHTFFRFSSWFTVQWNGFFTSFAPSDPI